MALRVSRPLLSLLALPTLPAAAFAQAIDLNAIDAGSGKSGDVYQVVDGDTLWDICQQFFGDSGYWPSLWSINNDEVTNPHYIYPGQRLRFEPGTDVRPPSVVVETDRVRTNAYDESFKPLVHFLATDRDCELYIPFSGVGESEEFTVRAPAFITRSEIEPVGVVMQAPDEKENLAQTDIVYMRFRNTSDVSCGDIYTLYHEAGEARHPEVRSARLGHIYRISAEVMVTDVGDKWVTGRVVQAQSEVVRGELIADRVPVSGRVRTSELGAIVDGYVIDKAHDENLLMQRNQIIFIDRGRSDGVQTGSTFWIVRRGDGLERANKQDDSLPDQVIGRLVVFAADENVSTAVLTDQAVDVKIGDRITSRID